MRYLVKSIQKRDLRVFLNNKKNNEYENYNNLFYQSKGGSRV